MISGVSGKSQRAAPSQRAALPAAHSVRRCRCRRSCWHRGCFWGGCRYFLWHRLRLHRVGLDRRFRCGRRVGRHSRRCWHGVCCGLGSCWCSIRRCHHVVFVGIGPHHTPRQKGHDANNCNCAQGGNHAPPGWGRFQLPWRHVRHWRWVDVRSWRGLGIISHRFSPDTICKDNLSDPTWFQWNYINRRPSACPKRLEFQAG